MLSRAFRNRFVELHVDDIPEDEVPYSGSMIGAITHTNIKDIDAP